MQSTHDTASKPHLAGSGQPAVGRPSSHPLQLVMRAEQADRLGQPMDGPLPSLQPMQAGGRPHQCGSGHVDVTLPASQPTQGQVATPPHSVALGQPTVDEPTTQPLQRGEDAGEGRGEEEREDEEEEEEADDSDEPSWAAVEGGAGADDDERGTGRKPHAEGSGQEGEEKPSCAQHTQQRRRRAEERGAGEADQSMEQGCGCCCCCCWRHCGRCTSSTAGCRAEDTETGPSSSHTTRAEDSLHTAPHHTTPHSTAAHTSPSTHQRRLMRTHTAVPLPRRCCWCGVAALLSLTCGLLVDEAAFALGGLEAARAGVQTAGHGHPVHAARTARHVDAPRGMSTASR